MRKQFPLTSIVEIVHNEEENPITFILQFEKSEILLKAHDKLDCRLWVKEIREGIVIYSYSYVASCYSCTHS